MNTVCMMIKKQTVPNFINLETMLMTAAPLSAALPHGDMPII